MSAHTDGTSAASKRMFGIFCVASYLLSVSYGTTFLLSLLVAARGGNEGDTGAVISIAMFSTVIAVIFSGHLTDLIGVVKVMAISGIFLALACIGFALTPGLGPPLLACGLLLGLGWGIFYTLGAIIVATMIEPTRRIKYLALLSGCMMSGIGTGPLIGRLATAAGTPIEAAFYVAAAASVVGSIIFLLLEKHIRHGQRALGPAPVGRITLAAARSVLTSNALFPIVMVGLGGCIFGALSSFQTSYAHFHKLDYSLFFIGFMVVAIICRLLVAGMLLKRDPYIAAVLLSGLIVVSILMFLLFVDSQFSYLLAAIVLGVGYGLTYSVINGLAANDAPPDQISQSLLLFSLSYIVGVFGFPFLAGKFIVNFGVPALLLSILVVAIGNWMVALARLIKRQRRVKSQGSSLAAGNLKG